MDIEQSGMSIEVSSADDRTIDRTIIRSHPVRAAA
jgi:hypothetical protein